MIKLLIFFSASVLFFSCNQSEKNGDTTTQKKQPKEITGENIYLKYCKLCHGIDGKLGLSNSANLSISILTLEEKIAVITNGRKGMTSFKDQLTAEQIKMVATYLETLHQ